MSNTDDNKKKLLSYADTYNSALKLLGRIYALKKKGTFEEEKVLRNNRRLSMVIEEEPMYMIRQTGMNIIRYRDAIASRDTETFMNMTFENEQQIYKQCEDGAAAKHTNKSMKGKIDFVKKVFRDATVEEQCCMWDAVTDLLSSYCQYVLHIKKYGVQHG